MNKTLNKCNPSICNQTDLATGEFEFLTKDIIKERCDCINKATCLAIVDLLDHGKYKEALGALDNIGA